MDPFLDEAGSRPVKPPSFQLLKEGDTPFFENAENAVGIERGGYLPDPELLGILDTTPRPPKPDYLRVGAAVLAVVLLGMAVRVIWYYSTNRVDLGTSPLQRHGSVAPVAALPAPAGPEDDTLYYAGPGVTLPVLLSKFEPQARSSGTVLLVVVIDPAGKPVDARVWHGLDADLNVRAIQAAGKWRFRPATKDGKPVPVTAQLEVKFRQP